MDAPTTVPDLIPALAQLDGTTHIAAVLGEVRIADLIHNEDEGVVLLWQRANQAMPTEMKCKDLKEATLLLGQLLPANVRSTVRFLQLQPLDYEHPHNYTLRSRPDLTCVQGGGI